MLLVVLPSIGDPFFTDVMRGVHEEAVRRGYGIVISDTQLNSLTANEVETMLVSRQADGIILFGTASPFGTEILSTRHRRAIPIVIGCEAITPELARFASVHIDNVAAAREATQHLIDLGHRSIAFIAGIAGSLLTADRERGYRRAIAAAGPGMAEPVVIEGGLTLDGAALAAQRLLAMKVRPTAIFCANDEMAIGAAHAIIDAGYDIPGDISLVGFDDTRYARVTRPALTTVMQPAQEIGIRSVRSIVQLIENPPGKDANPIPDIVPHRLIVRQSTGPAPGSGSGRRVPRKSAR
jgi:LacI family repressor for deo operon, udp, cdd, tsx, nupC, and nupG